MKTGQTRHLKHPWRFTSK